MLLHARDERADVDAWSALPPAPSPPRPKHAGDPNCLISLVLYFLVLPLSFAAFLASVPLTILGPILQGRIDVIHLVMKLLILVPGSILVMSPIVLFFLLICSYEEPLKAAANPLWDWILLKKVLEEVPWPSGRTAKAAALGRTRRTKALQRITQMSHAHDSTSAAARRRAARLAWRDFEVAAGDEDNLAVLQRACDGSFHIDFPNSEGQTLLMACSFSASPKSAAHLLALGADPNIQNASGRTALHLPASASHGAADRATLYMVLLRSPSTDPCVYSYEGKTAYMEAKLSTTIDALRPAISFAAIEDALANEPTAGRRAAVLRGLVPTSSAASAAAAAAANQAFLQASASDNSSALKWACWVAEETRAQEMGLASLRLPDLLFCSHEGPATELVRRRRRLWELLLSPMLIEAANRPLTAEEKRVVVYAWEASKGAPAKRERDHQNQRQQGKTEDGQAVSTGPRAAYAVEMAAVLKEVMGMFAAELAPVRAALLLDPDGKALAARPAIELRVGSAAELRHSRFLDCAPLGWALGKDLAGAAVELQRVGALASIDDLCDLLQFGGHRLVGARPRRDIFCGGSGAEARLAFWQGLVTLWLLAVHERRAAAFDAAIHAAASGENEVHAGPLKGFARIMEKAAEYEEERGLTAWEERVLAPLHVVDILRATVQVGSAARAAEVEAALLESMPLVRAKNGHSREVPNHEIVGGYRDQKLNLLLMSGGAEGAIGGSAGGAEDGGGGGVPLLVEVQILLLDYVAAKKKMHAVYRVHRGDFGRPSAEGEAVGSAAVGAASDRGARARAGSATMRQSMRGVTFADTCQGGGGNLLQSMRGAMFVGSWKGDARSMRQSMSGAPFIGSWEAVNGLSWKGESSSLTSDAPIAADAVGAASSERVPDGKDGHTPTRDVEAGGVEQRAEV